MTQTPPPPPPDNEGEGSATPPPPPPPAGPPPPAPPGYGGAAATPAGGGYDAVGAIKYGWSKFSAKPAELLVPMIVAWVATAVVLVIAYVILGALIFNTGGAHIDQSTGQLTVDQGPGYIGIVVGYAIVLLLTVLVSQFVGAAMVRGAVDVTDGQPVSLGSVWQNWDRTQVIVAGLLVAVGIAVGFVLCYIPGIIFGFLSQYTLYFVVDQKMSAVDAIKASFRFTTSHLGETIVFYLLAAVVTFIGALLCGLGLLVAIPVVLVGSAYTYRVLQGQQVTPA